MGIRITLYERVLRSNGGDILIKYNSFEEFKDEQEDIAEEVLASYPNIVNEKVINYYPNQLDWAESIIYPMAINRIDTKVFSTLYLVDLIDVNYLEEVMREQVDKSLGYVCSDGSIVTWIDESYD